MCKKRGQKADLYLVIAYCYASPILLPRKPQQLVTQYPDAYLSSQKVQSTGRYLAQSFRYDEILTNWLIYFETE